MGKTTALAWTWIVKVDTYNPRVRDFAAGHSGVYAFRTFRRGRWEVLYVGESHTDHLWRTSIRHLQDPKGEAGTNGSGLPPALLSAATFARSAETP